MVFDGADNFRSEALESVLVTGGRDDRSIVMDNLASQLILLEDKSKYNLFVWECTGGTDIDPCPGTDTLNLKRMSNCRKAYGATDCTLKQFLKSMTDMCYERIESDSMRKPGVIIIDIRLSAAIWSEEDFIQCVSDLVKVSSLSCELVISVPFFDRIMELYPLFKTRVFVDVPEDDVAFYLISREASVLLHGRGGRAKVLVGDRCYSVNVPFYSRKRKRKIWEGKILPYGCSFDKDRLKDWAVF